MISKTCIVLVCAFMVIHGHPMEHDKKSAFDHINDANEKLSEDRRMMLDEGDIVIPQGAAVDKSRGQWPNGVVPYTISNVFGSADKTKIRAALREIMNAAPCLNFKEYTFGSSGIPNAHVEVFRSGGCWSMVGRTGRKQQLSLGNGCMWTGTIIHEFLHAIGFYHEQSRPDRDQFVKINLENVRGGMEHNFKKASNINSLGVGYDRVSVMHYSGNAFSNGNGPTIEWKADSKLKLGGRVLSVKDKLQINLKYCSGPVPPTLPTTTTKMPKTTKKMTTPESTRPTPPTPPTKMTTSTERPTGVCGDKAGHCITVQFSKTTCSAWKAKWCPRSCSKCNGPKTEMCINLRDRSRTCKQQAARGDCQHQDRNQRWYMKNRCPKTCCERVELYKMPEY